MTRLDFLLKTFATNTEQMKVTLDTQQTIVDTLEYIREKKEWVGLTDEEIKDIVGRNDPGGIGRYTRDLISKIEAKLKEKNNAG